MKLDDVRSHYRGAMPARASQKVASEPSRASVFASLLEGRLSPIDGRPSFYVDTVHERERMHDVHGFTDVLGVHRDALVLISRDPQLASIELSRTVFLDTETTGLGVGTGTYAFLIGAGYMENGSFRVRRYFLDSPTDEAQFLDHLGSFLSRFTAIVTFNGKAFDWPILENRFILSRRPPPLDEPLHVDLLHVARRLWKKRLTSCALSSLETHVLGLPARAGDVPGAEIPDLYFQYQRTGTAGLLEPVFRHNLLDVLALAVLLVHACRVVANPTGHLCPDALDLYSVGRAYERAGAIGVAVECYEEALRRGLSSQDHAECLMRLAAIYRRAGDWESAAAVWDRLIVQGGSSALFALVERAKYLEHVERDYMRALESVQQALLLADLSNLHSTNPQTEMQQLDRRLSRLLNRTIRSRGWMSAAV